MKVTTYIGMRSKSDTGSINIAKSKIIDCKEKYSQLGNIVEDFKTHPINNSSDVSLILEVEFKGSVSERDEFVNKTKYKM